MHKCADNRVDNDNINGQEWRNRYGGWRCGDTRIEMAGTVILSFLDHCHGADDTHSLC